MDRVRIYPDENSSKWAKGGSDFEENEFRKSGKQKLCVVMCGECFGI